MNMCRDVSRSFLGIEFRHLLVGYSGCVNLVGDCYDELVVFCCGLNSLLAVLDKAELDVSGTVTGLGSSAGTGSGTTCSIGGAGRGSTVFLKTVSNTNTFLLEVLLVSKWN
ncbi:hypothetical protein Tco_1495705 [Tanacetum coccineum]